MLELGRGVVTTVVLLLASEGSVDDIVCVLESTALELLMEALAELLVMSATPKGEVGPLEVEIVTIPDIVDAESVLTAETLLP